MLEIEINGITHTFNKDLPYGELTEIGDRTHELFGAKMVAGMSNQPKLTLDMINALPSKKVTEIITLVLINYSKDFPKPPKSND